MRTARSFATFAIALTLLGSFATTRAGSVVVLNNLDQTPQPTGSSPFVGQSFIAGAPQELHGAQMQLDPTAPPSSNITLEVEARNADGTVGQTLFSDFSSSYDPRSAWSRSWRMPRSTSRRIPGTGWSYPTRRTAA